MPGPVESVDQIEVLAAPQLKPDTTGQPSHPVPPASQKPRRSRLRPDPELKDIPPMLFVIPEKRLPGYGRRHRLVDFFIKETDIDGIRPTSVILPGRMMPVLEQIDEILQENIAGTPLEKIDIHLLEDPATGVIVKVGDTRFEGVDAIPDPEVRAALRSAITQWEEEQKERNGIRSTGTVNPFARSKDTPPNMEVSDSFIKKSTIVFMTGLLVVIAMIMIDLFARPRLEKYAKPNAIIQTENMEVVWQRRDLYFEWANGLEPTILAQDNKIFFIGNDQPFYPNYGFVLDAGSGEVIAKTGRVEEHTSSRSRSRHGWIVRGYSSFTADGSAFYIINTSGTFSKYDYQKGQIVWSHKNLWAGSCCLRINNGDLFLNVYQEVYRYSTDDGSLVKDLSPWQNDFLTVEDGVYRVKGIAGRQFIGNRATGGRAWIPKINQLATGTPLIFRDGRVYIQTNYLPHALEVYDQQTAGLLWYSDDQILSNIAVSHRRAYFLTTDGRLLGRNIATGEQETSVVFSPENFSDRRDRYDNNWNRIDRYQVAYDDASGLVFLLIGESRQLIAFREQ